MTKSSSSNLNHKEQRLNNRWQANLFFPLIKKKRKMPPIYRTLRTIKVHPSPNQSLFSLNKAPLSFQLSAILKTISRLKVLIFNRNRVCFQHLYSRKKIWAALSSNKSHTQNKLSRNSYLHRQAGIQAVKTLQTTHLLLTGNKARFNSINRNMQTHLVYSKVIPSHRREMIAHLEASCSLKSSKSLNHLLLHLNKTIMRIILIVHHYHSHQYSIEIANPLTKNAMKVAFTGRLNPSLITLNM